MNLKQFTMDDQHAFADLSQDHNPIHTDPIIARRLIYGQPVAHGLNALLWMLSQWAKNKEASIMILNLNCKFLKPIVLDENVSLAIKIEKDPLVKLELFQLSTMVCKVKFEYKLNNDKNHLEPSILSKSPTTLILPKQLNESEMIQHKGVLQLFLNIEKVKKIYGYHLLKIIGSQQISELTALSRLVGMHVPGLNSILSEIELKKDLNSNFDKLVYQVENLNSRFHLIDIGVQTPTFKLRIKSFVRPELVQQNSFNNLKTNIDTNEFSKQRALIIGGSRGIGEVTAKLLAAGGADILITFHQGKNDAKRVVQEIITNGYNASFVLCNVLVLHPQTLKVIKDFKPTHVYYFATPYIFGGHKGIFSNSKFQNFFNYYVDGFYQMLDYCHVLGVNNFFYPSSVAIDEIPLNMIEYTIAKNAGEILSNFIEKNKPQIKIYKPRLPRMKTDQTVSILEVNNKDTLTILEYIRNFQKYLSSSL